MTEQMTLFKGDVMEEQLRSYFLSSGYYVVRGVKFKYKHFDITDIDLFLYNRSSSISRQRINVDIKNKKSPQAFERILWANGLKNLLNFDSCIVATTDRREELVSFGQTHNTTVLNGNFLKKLETNSSVTKLMTERLSEDILLDELSKYKDYKQIGNKTWRDLYETSKSQILTQQDFSGINSLLPTINYFIESILTDERKREMATRTFYLTVSHFLIMIDFILKDISFLDQNDRAKRLSDGFMYGNLGKDAINKIVEIAVELSNTKSRYWLSRQLENSQVQIFKEFFSSIENGQHLFVWAKQFESVGYAKYFTNPTELDSPLKAVIGIILDYFETDRKKFFGLFS
jgi:hypothetical protein